MTLRSHDPCTLAPVRTLVCTLAALVTLTTCSSPSVTNNATPTTTPSPASTSDTAARIPAQYQRGYESLQSALAGLKPAAPPTASTATTFGTELLAANGNLGTRLLAASTLPSVQLELDAFARLGVRGVTVDVAFPLLLPTTPNHASYLSFFKAVAAAVRAHDMVLSVESNVLFVNTPLTSIHVDFDGLTTESYASEQHEQAQLIIDNMHPQYLTVLAEPDTYSANLHLDLTKPDTAVSVVNRELDGLVRHDTKVGAGSGTWLSPALDQALAARTTIDYLDMHVFTLGPQSLANLRADLTAARAAQKPVVLDETWLDKPTGNRATGPQAAPRQLVVKSFDFWQPLDEQFVDAMTNLARADGFLYTSFYDGARAFFAYLPWSQALDQASYQEASAEYNRAVAVAMRSGTHTGTGGRFAAVAR